MLTEKAIEGFKAFIEKNIAYAVVIIAGVPTKTIIHRKERLADKRVAVYISITPQAMNDVTISRVQLYDKNNDLWADKPENILIKNVQEGVLYRFTFNFEEV